MEIGRMVACRHTTESSNHMPDMQITRTSGGGFQLTLILSPFSKENDPSRVMNSYIIVRFDVMNGV